MDNKALVCPEQGLEDVGNIYFIYIKIASINTIKSAVSTNKNLFEIFYDGLRF